MVSETERVRSGFLTTWMFCFVFSEKLLSLLPEYVVPYTIHLLAHDPDYVKVQDIEQLKDVKE